MEFTTDRTALQRLARGLLPSEHDAEDVIQDAWLRALSRPRNIEVSEAGWMSVVTRHLAMRAAARNARREEQESFAARPERTWRTPLAELSRREAHHALASAVDDLREPYRTALRLHYLEERTYSDMAQDLDLSVASVRSQVKRGLDQLRDRVGHRRSAFVGVAALLLLLASGRRRATWGHTWAAVAACVAAVLLGRAAVRADETAPSPGTTAPVLVSRDDAAPVFEGTPTALDVLTPQVPDARSEANARVASVDVAAVPTAPPLAGVVRDVQGEPLAGAELHLGSDAGARLAAVTDEAGRYRLEPRPGERWVWAEGEGVMASARHRLDTLGEAQRSAFALDLGFGLPELPLRLEDHLGQPLAGASLELIHPGQEAWGLQGTLETSAARTAGVTDAEGRAVLRAVSGCERMRVARPERPAWEQRVTRSPLGRAGGEGTLRLPAPASLAGRVLDAMGAAVPAARVTLRTAARTADGWALADPIECLSDGDGRFRLEHLPPGEFELSLCHGAHDPVAPSFAQRLTGTLEAGVEASLVGILGEAWSLRGRVDPRGAAEEYETQRAGPWRVLARSDASSFTSEQERWVPVGADGHFAVHGVHAPTTLFLFAPGESRVPLDRCLAQPGDAALHLRPGPAPRARLTGRLFAGHPGAWPEAWIEIHGRGLPFALRATTGEGGEWISPELPAGEYVVEHVLPGLGVQELQRLTLREGETRDLGQAPAPSPQDLHVRLRWPDPASRRVTFTLARLTSAGTLTKKTPGIGSRARGMTLRDDGLVVHDILPGLYRLTLRANGFDTLRDEVRIEAGYDAEIVLADPGAYFIRVRVEAPRDLRPDETRTIEVTDEHGTRRTLDPGDLRQRGGVSWLGRYLAPTDRRLEVTTSAGLRGGVPLTEAGIRAGRTVTVMLSE